MAVAGGNRGTLHTPGSNGGTDWAGGSYDPDTHMVYVYSQRTAATLGIIKNQNLENSDFEYVQGTPGQPTRVTRALGAAAAPAAPPPRPAAAAAAPAAAPAGGGGNGTVQGLPLLKPPYGTLSALDISKGTLVWQVAHGETPDAIKNHPALKGLKIPRTGQVGMVGPTTTKTLVICGDTGFSTGPDGRRGAMLRAYDKATGEEKGAVYIPAGTAGAPMTYMLGGRQYIVVACGGGNVTEEMIAFRLPRA
jgi:quinoprotein glucose dehydrogenase